MKNTFMATFVAIALCGCSGDPVHSATPRIDGHDLLSYSSSIAVMSDRLGPRENDEFRMALRTVQMAQRDNGLWSTNTSNVSPDALRALDGRTVQDVVNMANLLRGAAPP